MTDILIRDLPAKTVASLDELASKSSKSREAYVRELLNHHVMYIEVEGLNKKYENLVEQVSRDMLATITYNSKVIDKFLELHGVSVNEESGD